jgi:DNA-binding MarR family transcriptional regulator
LHFLGSIIAVKCVIFVIPFRRFSMSTQPAKTHSIGREARADMVTVVDAIRSIIQTVRNSGRETEQKLGISSAQLYVLSELRDRPALSINELADRTYTHQSSVSMIVARLVENRLVTRTASSRDGRRLSIALTPAGRALLRRSPDPVQIRLVAALRTMPRANLKQLAGGLSVLTEILGSQESQAPNISLKS